MKFGFGYRTMKTAIATGIAIAIAQGLDLQFYTSAGILAMLSIQSTKKRSYISAWQRILICVLALVLSVALFETIGYHPWSVSLFLFFMIPLAVWLQAIEGVVTSLVIILHLYILEEVSWGLIVNEMALIIIGVGIALLLNLYMPNVESILKEYRRKIEQDFSAILFHFAHYLKTNDASWDGKELISVSKRLTKAKALALKDLENHPYNEEYNYYRYFEMREKQFEVLERMMTSLSSVDAFYPQALQIAHFLEKVADALGPYNTATQFLEELEEMRLEFKESPLPRDREEFETRAELHHIVKELKTYLLIKQELKRKGTLGHEGVLWEWKDVKKKSLVGRWWK
ncbi:aromatic acid exporter family protein [Mechercharimyces sp. CAU 1602]|uniref:aromatic acid exporter family protein n=1 Tax=Mechercharimyces sp. CAU 1602 TaxID=2973933 RepID=UPI00216220F5|nr:aromatic acid exporter family protein [Mechercharimyces sp. CAU 1602]MCS1350393.1 aromatic acid exporter family protein [Mechercharimyces sp. CAU 1602]